MSNEIKTWQERLDAHNSTNHIFKKKRGLLWDCSDAMAAEIADLRAALAQRPASAAPEQKKELLLALQAMLYSCATASDAPRMSHLTTLSHLQTAIEIASHMPTSAADSGRDAALEEAKRQGWDACAKANQELVRQLRDQISANVAQVGELSDAQITQASEVM